MHGLQRCTLSRAVRAQRHLAKWSLPSLRFSRQYQDRRGRDIEPLRILYCGSDDFSVESLRGLAEAHRQDTSFIESIDVVCKTAKPRGRGLKQVYQSPIKAYAEEAGLPVHPISTFTKWQPPASRGKDINLIIAVSFGLFVPPRLLKLATYGGLNVHPSLLPGLRGPAPLQHTLLQDLSSTGLSICTLHPKHFDHGVLLRQQQVNVPEESMADYKAIERYMAPLSGALLVEGLREGCFLPPLDEVETLTPPSHAPKFGPEDTYIQWDKWPAEQILRMQKATSPLRSYWMTKNGDDVRVQFQHLRSVGRLDNPSASQHCRPGLPRVYWIKAPDEWVDRTNASHPNRSCRLVQDSIRMLDVPQHVADAKIRVGKNQGAAVGGIWTMDGHFLTFEAITIERGNRSKMYGGRNAIRGLYDVRGTDEQPFEVLRATKQEGVTQ